MKQIKILELKNIGSFKKAHWMGPTVEMTEEESENRSVEITKSTQHREIRLKEKYTKKDSNLI